MGSWKTGYEYWVNEAEYASWTDCDESLDQTCNEPWATDTACYGDEYRRPCLFEVEWGDNEIDWHKKGWIFKKKDGTKYWQSAENWHKDYNKILGCSWRKTTFVPVNNPLRL